MKYGTLSTFQLLHHTIQLNSRHFKHTYELKVLFWYICLARQKPVDEVHCQMVRFSVHLVHFTYLRGTKA